MRLTLSTVVEAKISAQTVRSDYGTLDHLLLGPWNWPGWRAAFPAQVRQGAGAPRLPGHRDRGGASHAPHPRESLAALLWPEQLDADALHDLRQALSQLRAALGAGEGAPLPGGHTPPPWPSTGERLPRRRRGLCPGRWPQPTARRTSAWKSALPACVGWRRRWPSTRRRAAERPGGGSAPFQEWLVVRREEFHRRSAGSTSGAGGVPRGAWGGRARVGLRARQLGLERWQEEAHRAVMRLLAGSGRAAAAALAQYEACRRALARSWAPSRRRRRLPSMSAWPTEPKNRFLASRVPRP